MVTKMYIEENYAEYDNSIGAYSNLSTRICTYTMIILRMVTKMYIEENYTEYDHSIGAYSKLSTRICTYTMIILCRVFLYIYFCDLKLVHSDRNMSSSA